MTSLCTQADGISTYSTCWFLFTTVLTVLFSHGLSYQCFGDRLLYLSNSMLAQWKVDTKVNNSDSYFPVKVFYLSLCFMKDILFSIICQQHASNKDCFRYFHSLRTIFLVLSMKTSLLFILVTNRVVTNDPNCIIPPRRPSVSKMTFFSL